MIKKTIVVATLLLALALVVTGCTGGGGDPAAKEACQIAGTGSAEDCELCCDDAGASGHSFIGGFSGDAKCECF
ncbi:hypothetical protein ACFL2B_00350 [Patescibacteria group bacterium]